MKFLFILLPIALAVQIQHVIEFCSSGAKVPKLSLSSSKYQWTQNKSYEVTPAGLRQHYLIGYEFRRRYVGEYQMLPFNYLPSSLSVHSSDTNRSIESVMAQLIGLYPMGTGPQLDNDIQKSIQVPYPVPDLQDLQKQLGSNALSYGFQPIAIDHWDDDEYIIDNGPWFCPKLLIYQNQYLQSKEFEEYRTKFDISLRHQIAKIAKVGTEQADILFALDFYEIIKTNQFHGFPHFEGVDFNMIEQLKHNAFTFQYRYSLSNQQVIRLKTGVFWYKLFSIFDAKIQGSQENYKLLDMHIFSGHEDMIAALLKSMQAFSSQSDYQVPPFASVLVFEIHSISQDLSKSQDENNYLVKVTYNDIELSVRGCDKVCPYPQMKKLLQSELVSNIQQECSVTIEELERFDVQHLDFQIRSFKHGIQLNEQIKSVIKQIEVLHSQ